MKRIVMHCDQKKATRKYVSKVRTRNSYASLVREKPTTPWGRGTRIYSREPLIIKGIATGKERPCQLEGCRGKKIEVAWPDHENTWVCTKGLSNYRNGMRIV